MSGLKRISSSVCPELRDGDVSSTGVTRDAFLGGKLEVLQPREGYRAGLDAVLLAAATPLAQPVAPKVLDCGAGVGTVGLCVAVRCPPAEVALIERQAELYHFAERNIALNHMENRVRAVHLDICAPGDVQLGSGLRENSFSHVVANPPFFVTAKGSTSPKDLKAKSHQMSETDLDLWLRFMARMAAPGGALVMIQHVDALPRLLQGLAGRFGGAQVVPIYPRHGAPANRIILCATKGSRAPFSVLPGFILHEGDNSYSAAAEAALKGGAALDFF